MATLYQNPNLEDASKALPSNQAGYSMPRKMDTEVPPRPQAMFEEITVDGTPIPETDILQEAQHHPSENPGRALHAAAEALVVRQLLLNEAEKLGIAFDHDTGNEDGETPEEAVIGQLLDKVVSVPKASEAECWRFYENNKDRFSSPPLYEVRHILLSESAAHPDRRQVALGKAKALCDELSVDPSKFGEFAKAYSDCPSAAQGGNLGQVQPGSTVAEFEKALEEMTVGMVAASPVETRYGYHVIALDRAVAPAPLPFSAVHEKITAWLEAQAWSRAMAQYVAILAGKAKICGISLNGLRDQSSATQAPRGQDEWQ